MNITKLQLIGTAIGVLIGLVLGDLVCYGFTTKVIIPFIYQFTSILAYWFALSLNWK